MSPSKRIALLLPALLAGFAPWFWIRPTPPIPSIVNESLAWVGWALLATWILRTGRRPSGLHARPMWSSFPLAVLGLLGVAVLADVIRGRLPYPSLGILVGAYLLMAAWCFCAGRRAGELPDRGLYVWDVVAKAWVAAALLTVGLGAWQYLRPEGHLPWIAALSYQGRVYANLRQPNHMATMLAMGWIFLVWLSLERRQVRMWLMLLASCVLLSGIALTGSRTGAVTVVLTSILLAALLWWRGPWRWWVLLFPLAYGLAWALLVWLDHAGLYASFGVERLRQMPQGTDVTGARRDAWLATWDMICAYPWTGVGTGRFGFFFILGNWSKPVTLQFNNAHNLVLHLMVEHGVPVVLVSLLLMGWYAVKCWQNLSRQSVVWIAFLLPVPVLVHSQFEFPLWYAYFLLPVFFAWGAMGAVVPDTREVSSKNRGVGYWGGSIAVALVLVVAPALLLWSNYRMQAIYFSEETPLFRRVQMAQESFLFRQHADHALLTSAPPELTNAPEVGVIFSAVAQVLTEARLLSNWTVHSAMNGQVEQAKHLAFALRNLDPEAFGSLRERVQRASDPQLIELAAFMQHPTVTPYPLDLLLSSKKTVN